MPDIKLIDGVAEGLNDPIRDAMMFATAEIVAQKLGLTREDLDKYAHGSYKKAFDALTAGTYDKYLLPVKYGEKPEEVLSKDEFVMGKTGFIEKPERFAKSPVIYEKMPAASRASTIVSNGSARNTKKPQSWT